MIRIALVQMVCEKADIDHNLEVIAMYLRDADASGVDIVAFPEMCLTGYADPQKYPQAVLELDGREVVRLLNLSEKSTATILAGLIERNPLGKPFITQLVIRSGVIVGVYRKITIEDEEVKWFSAGTEPLVFMLKGKKFGLAVCADIYNEAVFSGCARQGAEFVFELAAPGLYGEQATRNWGSGFAWWEEECQKYLARYAATYGLWIGVATQAGRTVDEDFPGGGYLFAPGGERVAATPDWVEGMLVVEVF